MNYKVTDNFLEKEIFLKMQKKFLGPWMSWYYNFAVLSDDEHEEHFQFTHMIYDDWSARSSVIEDVMPLIKKINPAALVRIKANLGTKTEKNEKTGFHKDMDFSCTTAVFYLNSNNGYTIFEDGTKIESIENRLVEFDSELLHSGVTQTDTKVRVLLNMNYIKNGGR